MEQHLSYNKALVAQLREMALVSKREPEPEPTPEPEPEPAPKSEPEENKLKNLMAALFAVKGD